MCLRTCRTHHLELLSMQQSEFVCARWKVVRVYCVVMGNSAVTRPWSRAARGFHKEKLAAYQAGDGHAQGHRYKAADGRPEQGDISSGMDDAVEQVVAESVAALAILSSHEHL